MILTSLRCFINHVCQLTKTETLISSYYHIIDVQDPLYETNVIFNDNGELCTQTGLLNRPRTKKMNNNYRVRYCDNALNPVTYTSNIMCVNGQEPSMKNKIDAYINHLKQPDVLVRVYLDMFNDMNKDTQATFLIMYDEELIVAFGHVIAEYLSQTFGEDIFFVDPVLRPEIKGHRDGFYKGNIENSYKIIRFCKDEKLRKDIVDQMDDYSYENTFANLTSLLAGYSMEDLFTIYEKYFPDYPLKPGEYRKEDIIEILIGRITKGKHFKRGQTYEDINPNIATYETELSEYERLANENIGELIDYTDLPF